MDRSAYSEPGGTRPGRLVTRVGACATTVTQPRTSGVERGPALLPFAEVPASIDTFSLHRASPIGLGERPVEGFI